MRQTRQTTARPYRLPLTGEMVWLMAWASVAQRAVGLQHGDLLVQQVALDQRRPEAGFQAVALQFFAGGRFCRERRLTGGEEGVPPCRQSRRRHTERA